MKNSQQKKKEYRQAKPSQAFSSFISYNFWSILSGRRFDFPPLPDMRRDAGQWNHDAKPKTDNQDHYPRVIVLVIAARAGIFVQQVAEEALLRTIDPTVAH